MIYIIERDDKMVGWQKCFNCESLAKYDIKIGNVKACVCDKCLDDLKYEAENIE